MDISPATSLFGPPQVDPVAVDWDAVESWVGQPLPADYKSLADTYGQFAIGDRATYLKVCTPCLQPAVYDYQRWLRETHRVCRAWARDVPPHAPPPFHPMPGGLLAWGETGAGTYFLWDTSASSDPDQWPVVAFHTGTLFVGIKPWLQWTELWRRYEMPLLEMLIQVSQTGVELPRGKTFGPLGRNLAQGASMAEVRPWVPPEPRREVVPAEVRRRALSHGSGLDALRLIQPPPDVPYLGGGTWDQLYNDLGTTLPTEYVALMETHGAGTWSEWLYFYAPLRREPRFMKHVRDMTDGYRSLRAEFPEYHPLPMWPELGGFLMFATTADGDEIGWLTDGDPDSWPVIVVPRQADQGPPLEAPLIHILLEWVRGRFSAEGFPGVDELDDPLDEVTFEPSDEHAYW